MDIKKIKFRCDFCKPIITKDFVLCKYTLKPREEYVVDYKNLKPNEIATIAFLISDKSSVSLSLYDNKDNLKEEYIKNTNESFDFQNSVLFNEGPENNGKLIIKNLYQTEASWLTFNALDKTKKWSAGLIDKNQDLTFDKPGYISMAYGFIKVNGKVIRSRNEYTNIIPNNNYSIVVDFNGVQIDDDFIGDENTCGIGIWATYE